MDLQAQDRCHRIGQTKPVMVFTLVTKNTIDERIIQRGEQKRLLEKIVTQAIGKKKEELKLLLSTTDIEQSSFSLSDQEIDNLLDRTELLKEMENPRFL